MVNYQGINEMVNYLYGSILKKVRRKGLSSGNYPIFDLYN